MKIAHLCLSCWYIDNYNYQENVLPRQHRADGHEVLIVASTETMNSEQKITYVEPKRYVNEDNIPVIRLPYRGRLLPHLAQRKLRFHPDVSRILEEFSPDVIFFHGLAGWELVTVARYVKRHPKVALYADCHEDWYNSGRVPLSMPILHKGYYRSVLKYALPTIRKVLCITPEALDFAREVYSVPPSQLELYPLGGVAFEDGEYADLRRVYREKLGVRDDEVVLLQSGKMGRAKKLLESLRAFRKTAADNLRLVLIGSIDESIRAEAMELINSTPHVRFLGWMSGSELNKTLCAADVYLQPGSQSVTMQNAICARRPVILDDVPSHRFLIDGNGWLLNEKTSLESVLQELARDPSVLPRMSERSFAVARRYLDYKTLAARVYE